MQIDRDDWQLNRRAFGAIIDRFGQPDVDLFASHFNTQLPVYFTIDTDAFKADWSEFRFPYANPPFDQISPVLDKIKRDKVRNFVLVCPMWDSQPWWPSLIKMAEDVIVFDPDPYLFRSGSSGRYIKAPNWTTGAFLIRQDESTGSNRKSTEASTDRAEGCICAA